jgi:hypothetical protein
MYGKLFASMYEGTLYGQWQAIVTLQQLVILADEEGVVDMTPPAIAARTSIPLDIIQAGIEQLASSDKYSRTPTEDGRRIVPIDDDRPWGWRIVNYLYYRNLASREDKRAKDRERIAAKRLNGNDVASCRNVSQPVADVAYTNTDTDTKKYLLAQSAEPKKSARKPDVVFEAIATACGIDWTALTKNERGALNNAAAQLREINATPDDIQARAAKYRQKWPGIDLTPMALVNNWNTVIAAPEQAECQIPHLSAPPHMKQDEYEMLDRRGKLAAYKRWGEIYEQRKAQANAAA